MFPSLLITFRETLEAALVVGIVLTFLTKTNQNIFKKFVWRGAAVGIGASILLAIVLQGLFGGLEGKTEELFEGFLMFITAGFLTWMILWVHRQKDIVQKLKKKVAYHIDKGYGTGIAILIAVSVLREGTETVLYLKASSFVGQSNQLTGALVGIIAALLLGYAIFRWAMRINLSLIFNITGIFLLLFAAGLISNGVHAFQEAGILPLFSFDPIFNISYILDHESLIGSFLETLFGYTSQPTFLQLVSYGVYVFFTLWLKRITDRILVKPATKP